MQNKKAISIKKPKFFSKIELTLPGSKSESNRALIISALSGTDVQIENLSTSEDTQIIQAALKIKEGDINCSHSGAALRFLCAYFASAEGTDVILKGSERLHERPVSELVDALIKLGADIRFLGKEGQAPLHIKGKKLQSSEIISIRSDISSQFISALMMIAPCVENGIQLKLTKEKISESYIEMTMQMMKKAGIEFEINKDLIIIKNQEYKESEFYIEPDWSAASYWYALKSAGFTEDIFLKGFKNESLQGDKIISEWMRAWDVETEFREDGIALKHSQNFGPKEEYDFINCPDIAQTMIILSSLRKQKIIAKGLQSLRIKETDRIKALEEQLFKLNIRIETLNTNDYKVDASEVKFPDQISVQTYHDHRMAMSFTPLCFYINGLNIEDPEVVEKSYPSFWKDLETAGFICEYINC